MKAPPEGGWLTPAPDLKPRMRVLSIMGSGVFGGPHNTVTLIAPILRSKGIETVVALPREPGDALDRMHRAGIEILELPIHRIRRTSNPIEHAKTAAHLLNDIGMIRQTIRARQIDLVHIQGVMNFHGAVAARLEGIPVVWGILERVPAPARRLMTPVVRRLATVAMVTGGGLIPSYPGLEKMGDRLVRFVPAVNIDDFQPNAERRIAARRQLGLPLDVTVIGNVGNINPDKDHRTFIRAAAELKKLGGDARFAILGAVLDHRRDYAENLWNEAAQLGLRVGTDLVVYPAGERVANLAQAFDIFWMTSRAEGLPAAIGEAMALGIAVIATDVGSIAEVIEPGVNGHLVRCGDASAIAYATLSLLKDARLREEFGRAGRLTAAARFDRHVCAETHRRVYETAIARKRETYRPRTARRADRLDWPAPYAENRHKSEEQC
jgi:glycosyltransferase involved in cell wall biosynthesis